MQGGWVSRTSTASGAVKINLALEADCSFPIY